MVSDLEGATTPGIVLGIVHKTGQTEERRRKKQVKGAKEETPFLLSSVPQVSALCLAVFSAKTASKVYVDRVKGEESDLRGLRFCLRSFKLLHLRIRLKMAENAQQGPPTNAQQGPPTSDS